MLMEVLFFAVVIISAVLTLARVPGLSHSRNQAIFLSGLCACIAFGLMLPAVYGYIDSFFLRKNRALSRSGWHWEGTDLLESGSPPYESTDKTLSGKKIQNLGVSHPKQYLALT